MLRKDSAKSHFDDLTITDSTYQLQIELTTYCNLHCIYCVTLSPEHKRENLDLSFVEQHIDELLKRNLKSLAICGYGELTIVKDWQKFCNRIIDSGINLQITSNLAKELTTEEAETMSKCTHINVSCDTVDIELFRQLRRGADLRTIVYNINLIRSMSFRDGRLPPQFTWYCVVTDKNIFKLNEYINFARAFGIYHFHFCNFCKHDIPESVDLYPISTLPEEQLKKIPDYLKTLSDTISVRGAWAHFDAGLLGGVLQKLQYLRDRANGRDIPCEGSGSPDKPLYASSQKDGMTRDCLLPW
jgi:molybdenum cofactor biosynthesis enzyme MoaA